MELLTTEDGADRLERAISQSAMNQNAAFPRLELLAESRRRQADRDRAEPNTRCMGECAKALDMSASTSYITDCRFGVQSTPEGGDGSRSRLTSRHFGRIGALAM